MKSSFWTSKVIDGVTKTVKYVSETFERVSPIHPFDVDFNPKDLANQDQITDRITKKCLEIFYLRYLEVVKYVNKEITDIYYKTQVYLKNNR